MFISSWKGYWSAKRKRKTKENEPAAADASETKKEKGKERWIELVTSEYDHWESSQYASWESEVERSKWKFVTTDW